MRNLDFPSLGPTLSPSGDWDNSLTSVLLGLCIWWGCYQDCPRSPSPAWELLDGGARAIPRKTGSTGAGGMSCEGVTLGTRTPLFPQPASPVSRSVARTTMTDVPIPAVSRSPRRLYCCCVNTGASSLTSSTYTITCRSQTGGGKSRLGGDPRSPGLGPPGPACVAAALPGQR